MKSIIALSFALLCMISFKVDALQDKTNKKSVVGKKFPQLESYSLAGNLVKIPEDLNGKMTLITVAFFEAGQPYIDSWAEPYLENYFPKQEFEYYEVPMISDMPDESKQYINSGMRAGIDKKMHPNVVTFYGDYKPYLEELGMSNLRSGYAFLLNKEGTIVYAGEGMMTEDNWKDMSEIIQNQSTGSR